MHFAATISRRAIKTTSLKIFHLILARGTKHHGLDAQHLAIEGIEERGLHLVIVSVLVATIEVGGLMIAKESGKNHFVLRF